MTDAQAIDEWCRHKHTVYEVGWPVDVVAIHPTARTLIHFFQMHVFINLAATEKRWEAHAGGEFALSGNPNLAIADCARKIRKAREPVL